MKRFLPLLLCLVLCLALLPAAALAEGGTAASNAMSGDEGTLHWTLSDDGILTLRDGTGEVGSIGACPRDLVRSVVFDESTTRIGSGLLYDCGKLSSVQLPSKLKYIESWVFEGCSSLETITIPASVTSIDLHAFSGADGLKEILVNSGNTKYKDVGGVLFSKDGKTLVFFPAAKASSYTIPSGVTKIQAAFSSNKNLKSVTMPDTVTSIEGSFKGCSALSSVTLSANLKTVGSYAFAYCSSLKSISIPSTVTKIGDCAFTGCSALKTVSIPSSVKTIGTEAFAECGSLSSVVVPGSVTAPGERVFSACTGLTKATVKSGVKSLGAGMFENCGALQTVTLPEGLQSVGTGCFSGCGSLHALTLPDSLLSIGYRAFAESGLTSVTIPAAVGTQGENLFEGCGSLTKIILLCDSTAVTASSLYDATATAYYPADNASWTAEALEKLQRWYRGSLTWVPFRELSISAQPKSQTVNEGKTAKFTVTATGAESYRWQYRTSPTGTWHNSTASSATTASMSVTATEARSGYQYRCKLTNVLGSVYTDTVTLTVALKPRVTVQPTDKTVNEGKTAAFTVTATGAESYQWQYSKSETGSWYNSSAASAKSATLSLAATEARNGFRFRCKVTNAAGTTYSSAATLTVHLKPRITAQPTSQTAAAGDTASFTVTATGAESYRWQCRTSETGSWYNSTAASATTANMRIKATAARNGYQYRCKVTNAAGTTISDVVTLTVKQPPVITGQPTSQTVNAGDTASFTVTATGAASYQWQCRTSASGSWYNSTAASAATANMRIKATAARNGYQYRCRITNEDGSVYTVVVTLTVK